MKTGSVCSVPAPQYDFEFTESSFREVTDLSRTLVSNTNNMSDYSYCGLRHSEEVVMPETVIRLGARNLSSILTNSPFIHYKTNNQLTNIYNY